MSREFSNYDLVVISVSQAIELIKNGECAKAAKILDHAVELADAIEDLTRKFFAFLQLARTYMMLDNKSKAEELLESIDSELKGRVSLEDEFYRLIIRAEKIKFGLVSQLKLKEELEDIRMRFEDLLRRSNNRIDILRHYLAFIILLWGPILMGIDIQRVERVLTRLTREYHSLGADPQYGEIITLLAEVYVRMGKYEQAVEEIKEALKIYSKYSGGLSEEIRDILLFVKKYLPTKYGEILNYLRNLGIPVKA